MQAAQDLYSDVANDSQNLRQNAIEFVHMSADELAEEYAITAQDSSETDSHTVVASCKRQCALIEAIAIYVHGPVAWEDALSKATS